MEQTTYKEKLISIYKDLDTIAVESIQEEIDKIKSEVDDLIQRCEDSENEKEKVLIDDFIKEEDSYIPIQPTQKRTKPLPIRRIKDENVKPKLRDWLILGGLIVVAAATIVCLCLL